jgi:urease accessory protein
MVAGRTELSHLLDQRSVGEIRLKYGRNGLLALRESGCSKLRQPQGSHDAIIINTSGGLAGGDEIAIAVDVHKDARLCITSQAAERVYRTLGPPAQIAAEFSVSDGASLAWLPQETIVFNGGSLDRRMTVKLAGSASFVGVESIVLGRTEMGEDVTEFHLRDRWDVWRDGVMLHAERTAMGPGRPTSTAGLGEGRSFATVIVVSTRADALLPMVLDAAGAAGSASCWNGKLLARLVAVDGFALRKALVRVLHACIGSDSLPRNWSF